MLRNKFCSDSHRPVCHQWFHKQHAIATIRLIFVWNVIFRCAVNMHWLLMHAAPRTVVDHQSGIELDITYRLCIGNWMLFMDYQISLKSIFFDSCAIPKCNLWVFDFSNPAFDKRMNLCSCQFAVPQAFRSPSLLTHWKRHGILYWKECLPFYYRKHGATSLINYVGITWESGKPFYQWTSLMQRTFLNSRGGLFEKWSFDGFVSWEKLMQ